MSETPAIYAAGQRPHHPHGPSQIGNPCNAAWKLSQYAPEPPASADADEGTLLHRLIAQPDPEALAELEEEPRGVVLACRAQAQAWADSVGCLRPYREEWLELRDMDTGQVNSGTADFVAVSRDGTQAIVADWKTGRSASPLVADQLACYAAMVMQAWPTVQTVEAHAWYPRAPRLNQSWTYTRADLPGLVERIQARIAVRIDPERWEYETGDHCIYCWAALLCGARRREVATVETAAMTVESLAPADIAALLPRLKRVEKISDAIKARAKALAGAGELPGYRLVEVRGREVLSDDAGAVNNALLAAGFDGACIAASQRFDLSLIRATAKAAGVSLEALAPLVTRTGGYQKLVKIKES